MNQNNQENLDSERTTIQKLPDIDTNIGEGVKEDFKEDCKSLSTHKVSQVFGSIKQIEEEEHLENLDNVS